MVPGATERFSHLVANKNSPGIIAKIPSTQPPIGGSESTNQKLWQLNYLDYVVIYLIISDLT